MVRLAVVSPYLWTVAATGLYAGLNGSFAGAVMVKSKNGTSNGVADGTPTVRDDGLEASQSRVDERPSSNNDHNKRSDHRVSGKEYDGDRGYPLQNTYGPPKDYYYHDRPEHHRPNQHSESNDIFNHYPQVEHHHSLQNYGGGDHPHFENGYGNKHNFHHYDNGEGHHFESGGDYHPGQLNIQPLLWPLAGITLLGVLSALVKTPLLLNLGHIGRRRRRRRDTDNEEGITAETIKSLLERFNDKGQRRFNPQTCLVCDVVANIYDQKSTCVERSVCEVMSRNDPGGAETDKRLLTAMIGQVIKNVQIPEEFKKRLETAETSGRNGSGNCKQLYPCGDHDGAQSETVWK